VFSILPIARLAVPGLNKNNKAFRLPSKGGGS